MRFLRAAGGVRRQQNAPVGQKKERAYAVATRGPFGFQEGLIFFLSHSDERQEEGAADSAWAATSQLRFSSYQQPPDRLLSLERVKGGEWVRGRA